MIQIIDASVALKWFVREEPGRDEALACLEEIKNDPRSFAVPELFFEEILSIFCRIVSSAKTAVEYLNLLQDLGMARFANGRKTLETAAHLAKKFGLTGYDAIYVANARLVDGIWITADKKAHLKLVPLKISRLIGAT